MALSDIISVSISVTSPGVTREGFGTGAILSANWSGWSERVRFYTDIDGVGDDFADDTPEFSYAEGYFSQRPRPKKLAIVRLDNKPTQKRTLTPVVANSTAYALKIITPDGTEYSYSITSDGSATGAEIVAALITAINAGSASHFVVATGSTTLVLTASAAGKWADVVLGSVALFAMVQDHADPGTGVKDDLDAAELETGDFYDVINPWNSSVMAQKIAEWVDARDKIFMCGSSDSDTEEIAVSGSGGDFAKAAKTAGYANTAVWYSRSLRNRLDADISGKRLPEAPGSENWGLTQLRGPSADRRTATQRTNILARYANLYEAVSGRSVTQEGKMASGQYIDVVRAVHWLNAEMAADLFEYLTDDGVPKRAFTDQEIANILNVMRGTLMKGVRNGFLKDDFTVSAPKAADVAQSDKDARHLPDLLFAANGTSAINSIAVRGKVTQ